jgi:hypothetical protein
LHRSDYVQSERTFPALRLHSSFPLHIIRRFTQYFRNDYLGIEQWSRTIERGRYVHLSGLHEQHKQFAKQWDNNLRSQGFAEAFERQQALRA